MVCQGSSPAYQFAACGVAILLTLSLNDIHAVPRGASSHLYTAAVVTSAQPTSTRFQPSACVMSITISVSLVITFCRSASVSSTAPFADCTRLTVTTSNSPARFTSSSAGISVIVTPLLAWAANGKVVLVNSPSNVATRLPSGIAAATNPRTAETVPPITTDSTGTPA